jgi:Peptidase inhibitor family I36
MPNSLARGVLRYAPMVTTGIALMVLGAVAAPPATADRSDCPAEYLCLWDGYSYGGTRVQFHDNGWQNLSGSGLDNAASSVYNNTNRWATLSMDPNGGGLHFCVQPGIPQTFSGVPLWDNQVSAVNLQPGGCV